MCTMDLVVLEITVTLFFFFFFHLELLRCWVSYLSKWEKVEWNGFTGGYIALQRCECLLHRALGCHPCTQLEKKKKETHNYGRVLFPVPSPLLPHLFVHIVSPSHAYEFSNIWDPFNKVVFLFFGWESSRLCHAVLFISFFWHQTEAWLLSITAPGM